MEAYVPSSRRVVSWPWSSGPLMLPEHKSYLVAVGVRSVQSRRGQSLSSGRWLRPVFLLFFLHRDRAQSSSGI